MKSIRVFLTLMILAASAVTSFVTDAYAQGPKKVLMIPREGYSSDLDLMLKMEVGVMTRLLKDAGLEVDIATPSGQSILGATEKITGIKQLRSINLDDYAGVIIPCMAVGSFPGPAVPTEVVEIVRKAVATGKPVAANGNAPITLAEAGVLKGKKYSFMRDPLKPTATRTATDERFIGAIYSGAGVVQDGKIITSGVCPSIEKAYGMQGATATLTKAFIATVTKA